MESLKRHINERRSERYRREEENLMRHIVNYIGIIKRSNVVNNIKLLDLCETAARYAYEFYIDHPFDAQHDIINLLCPNRNIDLTKYDYTISINRIGYDDLPKFLRDKMFDKLQNSLLFEDMVFISVRAIWYFDNRRRLKLLKKEVGLASQTSFETGVNTGSTRDAESENIYNVPCVYDDIKKRREFVTKVLINRLSDYQNAVKIMNCAK